MAIEEITVPMRTRAFTREDAQQAFNLLSNDKAAKYGSYNVSDFEGRKTKDGEDADPMEVALRQARSDGATLAKLIEHFHGRKFSATAWKDSDGLVIGALLPKDARKFTGRKRGQSRKTAA